MQCLHRWQKVLNPALCKGPWTPEVRAAAPAARARAPRAAGAAPRGGWPRALLAPSLSPADATRRLSPPQEDVKILALVKELGFKSWAKIASMLAGRIGKQCRERRVCSCARLRPAALTHARPAGGTTT